MKKIIRNYLQKYLDTNWIEIAGINAEIGQHNYECFEAMMKDRDRWKDIADRLGTHMGEGLYTDDWECREYAIAAYADWERQPESRLFKYDFDPQPVWYFKEGKNNNVPM
jgi:hypothetical protein